MVSDFVDQHRGFLQLSDEEHANISAEEPDFPKSACVLFEYVAEKEGYWRGDTFLKNAVKIAEHIYTPATHTIIWFFDQTSQSTCRGFVECSSDECFSRRSSVTNA